MKKKQYKSSMTKNHGIERKYNFDGVPLALYLICKFWAFSIQQQIKM